MRTELTRIGLKKLHCKVCHVKRDSQKGISSVLWFKVGLQIEQKRVEKGDRQFTCSYYYHEKMVG